MEQKRVESEEILSLNSEITEFDVQKLEERLETDPLAIGGLLDLASTQDLSQSISVMNDCECHCSGWFQHNN